VSPALKANRDGFLVLTHGSQRELNERREMFSFAKRRVGSDEQFEYLIFAFSEGDEAEKNNFGRQKLDCNSNQTFWPLSSTT
jgi:hypothetical protein